MSELEFDGVVRKKLDLRTCLFVGYAAIARPACRNRMIGNEQVTVWASDLPTAGSHAGKSLRTAHLVQQLPVYVQQTRSIGIFTDKMRLPKLVIQRLSVQKVSLSTGAEHCPTFSDSFHTT